MNKLATSWSLPDPQMAIECFTEDAIYMQPPNIQLYQGHDQLSKYFGALTEGYFIDFHSIWFDEQLQKGCIEFTFGKLGHENADTGTIVIELKNGKIAFWREYFQNGPTEFSEFISKDDKNWQWHIGNYP